jgi:hypothetical protein
VTAWQSGAVTSEWRGRLLVWVLAAFFAFGGVVNIVGVEPVRTDFARWGYPGWFHLLTGGLELAVAVLLACRATRAGAALGAGVMTAAATTVLAHGEYLHAVAPLVVLVLLALAWRRPPARTPEG